VPSGRPAAKNRAFRLNQHAEYIRVEAFDGARHAREGPGCACADDDGVNASLHLLYNLARGRLFVVTGIRRILKLLRDEAILNLCGKCARPLDCACHSLLFGDVLDFTTESFHHLHLLTRVAFRHAEYDAITARNADES
jgi:hypothetical protein